MWVFDHAHHAIHDHLGQSVGQIDHDVTGDYLIKDQMGFMVARLSHTGHGFSMLDHFGMHLGSIGDLDHGGLLTDHLGQHLAQVDLHGGKAHLHDAMGQTLLQYDPLTGNISDALGMAVGAIR